MGETQARIWWMSAPTGTVRVMMTDSRWLTPKAEAMVIRGVDARLAILGEDALRRSERALALSTERATRHAKIDSAGSIALAAIGVMVAGAAIVWTVRAPSVASITAVILFMVIGCGLTVLLAVMAPALHEAALSEATRVIVVARREAEAREARDRTQPVPDGVIRRSARVLFRCGRA